MKVSELMDGDLLMYGGHLCRFVIRAMDAVIERLSDDSCYPPCACVEAEPIPLTEEILKANGFDCPFEEGVLELRTMAYGIYICLKRHCVNIQVHFREIADEAQIRIHCSSVHELQHALRLCGLNELADNFKV